MDEQTTPVPEPVARRTDKVLECHADKRVDPYHWLNQRESPEVIDYLGAENAYLESKLAHTSALQEELFQEIIGRLKPDDSSVPYQKDGYFYYSRFEKDLDYAIHCRRKGSMDAPEVVLLDGNEIAKGKAYFSLGGLSVASDQNLLAYAMDTVGRRIYTIHFKDLKTGNVFSETLTGATGNMAWAEDGKTLFYTKQDPDTLRSYQVFRHRLGDNPADDALVFEEEDETFSCGVYKTKSKRYLLIASEQTVSSEYHYCRADTPDEAFRVFLPRERDHEYAVDHYEDHFYVRTNWNAKNFRLMRTQVNAPERSNWEEVIPHRADIYFEDLTIFRDFVVLEEREAGLPNIRVVQWQELSDGTLGRSGAPPGYTLDFDEPAYLVYLGRNPEFETNLVRFRYSSMTTPGTTFDLDMATKERTLLKQDIVLGGFHSEDYRCERLLIDARDGVQVPVSLVYRRENPPSRNSPLLAYAYGSYGHSTEAAFGSARLSLLDRGFAFAIIHTRGGSEKGRSWYEGGKLLEKKNTFFDFIDGTEALVGLGYADPARVYALGGSAGGLLVGAVINLRADLFHGAVAEVPFVDVVTTMLDASIPLTTSEYDEWGNPNEKEFYDYILSYSPYDNVAAKNYPHLLVTTGLHDSQVQYWEPAKWVAKLRTMRVDSNLLLLKTNLEAGHSGASGRYRRHRETALVYAFFLNLAQPEST